MDDQIGFLIPAGTQHVLAVTIDSGMFIVFKYDKSGKAAGNQVL